VESQSRGGAQAWAGVKEGALAPTAVFQAWVEHRTQKEEILEGRRISSWVSFSTSTGEQFTE